MLYLLAAVLSRRHNGERCSQGNAEHVSTLCQRIDHLPISYLHSTLYSLTKLIIIIFHTENEGARIDRWLCWGGAGADC